ncbi:Multidrug resistance protein 1 [Podila humilis]|nr:Multidrug resistance protein 1 [Podila humilis]
MPSSSEESTHSEKNGIGNLHDLYGNTPIPHEVVDIPARPPTPNPVTEKAPTVSYFQLYRFASTSDWILIALGCLCSLANGVGQPLIALLMGEVVTNITLKAPEDGIESVRVIVIKFTVVGCIVFVASYGQMCFWSLAAERQTKRIRELYLHAILRQDISWHDTGKKRESLSSRLASDTQLIYDGLADRVGLVLNSAAAFLAGFIIAFSHGWRMTLVILSVLPLMAESATGQGAYAAAGGMAEQAISAIRTVVSFDGQQRELERYTEKIQEAYKTGIRTAIVSAFGMGALMATLMMSYGLAFWYGSKQVAEGHMEPGDVLTVLFGVIIGASSLGNVGGSFSTFGKAKAAAYTIFQTIDRIPEIDSSSPLGLKPENIKGHIVLSDVAFAYPSRPDVPVLKNLNIEVLPGQTIALVGHSGSGKSTIVGLLDRFYDTLAGSISFDGIEIKDWNVTHLRDTIGIVSQEPVLFNATIKQNIIYGTRKSQPTPSDREIEEVCRLSNASDFIAKLPDNYETMVGEKGALLSGGQKQRIAIARALIKNPRILLLDEATSALDTESERVVQAALDNAAAGRSTIVIAHRLSTVVNADHIYVLDAGVVLESGTHESLMALGGTYSELVEKQRLKVLKIDLEASSSARSTPVKDNIKLKSETEAVAPSQELEDLDKIDISKATQTTIVEEEQDPDVVAAREKKEAAKRLRAQKAPIRRTLNYVKADSILCVFGVITAMIQGAVFPLLSQVMSKAITTLFGFKDPTFDYQGKTNFYALLFVAVGAVTFVSFFGNMAAWYTVGERVTRKMRYLSYKSILSQEIAFFDKPENTTGALAGRLATDAQQMFDMVSQVIVTSLSALTTVVVGLGFAFAATWQMTLIVAAAVPLLSLGQVFEMTALDGFGKKTRKAYEHSSQVAAEAISHIRTVVSLAKESAFEEQYRAVILRPHQIAIKRALFASFGYAMSQGIGYWAYAIGFYGGYRLVDAGIITWAQMFDCIFSVLFMATSLGYIASELPKYSKGKQSAINIYELLDKNTTIDADKDGIILETVEGDLALENVNFTYPTRPDTQIFQQVSIQARPSQTVALVGHSGCGKSTVISLLERWYDTDAGQVTVDKYDIRDLQLHHVRNHMALVSQEPVLFDLSVEDNILYGLADGKGSLDHVVAAAQQSNIHEFIMSLPDGYKTRVGDKGSQLSGGQKQRVAIARALIRDPKILLLDEATSALDTESEKLVQEALDKARTGRTTIVIAHRLSTIQDADLILVVKDGVVVESGQHFELLALGGLYAGLCKQQDL